MINIKKPVETEINGQRYEYVEMFKHLCSLVTNTDEVETEIKARVIAGSKCFNALGHLLKKDMYNSEIIPTRCNNCVYSSQWLYSTCFGRQSHPSSGVQCCIWPFR
jgi:hypothetical protein